MSRPAKACCVRVVVVVGVLASASAAVAQHQPMAIAPGTVVELGADGAPAVVPAYCFDFSRVWPDKGEMLANVATGAKTAKVCDGSDCIPLQEAIDHKLVAVKGTGAYSVSIHNLTSKPLKVKFDEPTAFSDTAETLTLPASSFPTMPREHDGLVQYRVWRSFGQVDEIVTVMLNKRPDGAFDVLGFDRKSFERFVKTKDKESFRPAVKIEKVDHTKLGETIAQVAEDKGRLIIFSELGADRVEALVADVGARTSGKHLDVIATNRGSDRLPVMSELLEVAPAGAVKESAGLDELRAPLKLSTVGGDISAEVVLKFAKPQRKSYLARVKEAITRVVAKVKMFVSRGTLKGPALDYAALIRKAVETEVAQLQEHRAGDAPSIRILLGRVAGSYYIVRIERHVGPGPS